MWRLNSQQGGISHWFNHYRAFTASLTAWPVATKLSDLWFI